MPKLSDLLAEKARAEIQVGGSTIGFTYFALWRQRFSDDEWAEISALRGREWLKRFLPPVVTTWDIVDNDGHAIAVTAEAIEQHEMPDALLYEIEVRILGSDLSGKVISSNSRAT